MIKNQIVTHVALAGLPFLAGTCYGMVAQPSLMPMELMLDRAHAFLDRNPDNAMAFYTIGRIHHLAFYQRSSMVPAYRSSDPSGLPGIAPYWTTDEILLKAARHSEAIRRTLVKQELKVLEDVPPDQTQGFYNEVSTLTKTLAEEGWKPKKETPEMAAKQAVLALDAFDRAIALDPSNPLYLLGKASLLEQAFTFLAAEKLATVDPGLAGITPKQIRDAYYEAYTKGAAQALKIASRPVEGLRSIPAYEAGDAYLRLCAMEDQVTEDEQSRVAGVTKSISELDLKKRGVMTR